MNGGPTAELARLFEVMALLRSPDGCPWDRVQTHQSLLPFLLEETYETIEAIECGGDSEIAEELGDLLVEVAMQVAIGAERGAFDLNDVASRASAKMISRHPHVFAETRISSEAQLLQNWDALKRSEKPDRASALDGIPDALPGLALATSVQRRAARAPGAAGPSLPRPGEVARRLQELVATDPPADDADRLIGELLWAVVGMARELKVDPEGALRRAVHSWAAVYRFAESTTVVLPSAQQGGTTAGGRS